MIGCNIFGMMWRALYLKGPRDLQMMANFWGFNDPCEEMVNRRADVAKAFRKLRWWRLWHKTKHFFVEWTALNNQRSAKMFLDFIVWAGLLGFLLGKML